MIQGIQGPQKFIGINPGETQPKPQAQPHKEKGPDIGALLGGKKPDGIKTVQDSIQNRLGNIEKIGAENKKPLDIKV
ncbi:MAG: hypothetical protein A2039_01805 [Candidatus Melainabacteria bacterium GWA2_34_9]|nr:MAG: hypothetical protein A2039_01805 [Candidatus Melainabacteria bacterium GWA2_34_9]